MADRANSVANASGAAYGATAYRQGFYDGVELISGIDRIGQGSMVNMQDFDSGKMI